MMRSYNPKINRSSLFYIKQNIDKVNCICRKFSDSGSFYSFLCAYLNNGEVVNLTTGAVDFIDEKDGIDAFFLDPEVDERFKDKFVEIGYDFVVSKENFLSFYSQPCAFSGFSSLICVRFKKGKPIKVKTVYNKNLERELRELKSIVSTNEDKNER